MKKSIVILISILSIILFSVVIVLVVDNYKLKKDVNDIKNKVEVLENTSEYVEPIDINAAVSSNMKDHVVGTSKYQKMIDDGIVKIDKLSEKIEDFATVYALEEISKCNVTVATGLEWQQPSEFEKIWKDMIKSLKKDIYKIINSDDDIDSKLCKIDKYGVLAQPVMKSVCEQLEDNTNKDEKYEITYKFNEKEKKKVMEYFENYKLSDTEQDALNEYIK